MENSKMSRRQLILSGFGFAVAAPVSMMALSALAADAKKNAAAAKPSQAPALKLVPLTDPVAVGLKYNPDASKVDKKLRKPKMGVAGDKQFCSNCQLYTKKGTLDGQEVGQCTMIAGGAVTAKGWCSSWMKKA